MSLILLPLLIATINFIYRKKSRPMLLIFSIFSLFYLNVRGWLLDLGIYNKYAYLNPSVNLYNVNDFYHLNFIIFASVLLVYFAYCTSSNVKFKILPMENLNFNRMEILIGLLLSFCIGIVYKPIVLFFSIYCFCYLFLMRKKTSLFFIVIIFIYLIFYTDDRRDFLAFLLMVMFLVIRNRNILKVKNLVYGLISVVGITITSVILRGGGDNVELMYNNPQVIFSILEVETDFSIVYDDLIYLLDQINSGSLEFLYGITLVKPLLYIFPNGLLFDKPESFSVIYAKVLNPWFYQIGGSQPATFVGEIIWNLGFLSIFGFIALGIFLSRFDYLTLKYSDNHSTQSLACSLFCIMFSILRGPLDTFVLSILFLYLIIFVMFLVNRIR
ncbi:TPA: oligosaccharide repeat unit polymerase [Vibrio parahaemolyticus]|nr:oligosaccharide repeat unit polymerase [Vibrio parahaemolyticus]MDF4915465.1 oligosaccharide repeat unit polymerase [Vibrio parahaemolyticus]HBC3497174.1 oligosaccharide repeat unit polymerase [Vibrio parahaemolyticus]HBC3953547.1 oligosaccharide repeat unit polymerase [Vibrio parahaemolyticus]